ncbi:MAG TPA: TMEM175 family protein [Candidatus Dormibacteraeota bacterium]|nr:TMEM175 family protein [Candidatus Dormibacteraeota bacterium]
MNSSSQARRRRYNELAGTNLGRLEAISDGIFAVGMTLLVLGLAQPMVAAVKNESDLLQQLQVLVPSVVTYVMSFLTLGIFWIGQQTQLSSVERADRNFSWIHLTFLLTVTLVPFTTQLLAHFHWSRVALIVYWLNIFVMGSMLLVGAEYGARARLFPEQLVRPLLAAVRRRVYGAQALYFAAMLLSIFDTHWSIGMIVAIQLNFALAPPIPFLRSL